MKKSNNNFKNSTRFENKSFTQNYKVDERVKEILLSMLMNPSIVKQIENALLLDSNVEINSLIFKSQKYNEFKVLQGNRELNKANLKKLEDSIKKYGYRESQPITINENAEIINGQHRNYICQKLNLPIFFNFENCITNSLSVTVGMNVSQKNWGLLDFVRSYADLNNQDYINFLSLINTQSISSSLILWILYHSRNGNIQDKVKSGNLKCSKADVERVKKTVELLREIQGVIPDTLPKERALREAILSDKVAVPLAVIMEEKNYNHNRMLKQVERCYNSIDRRNMSVAGDTLVNIYNLRLKDRNSRLKPYTQMESCLNN